MPRIELLQMLEARITELKRDIANYPERHHRHRMSKSLLEVNEYLYGRISGLSNVLH